MPLGEPLQLTLDAAQGEALKQAGLDQVEGNNLSFVETMRMIAKGIFFMRGEVTSDDLRLAADKAGLKPNHPNCWGAVMKGPEWRVVGRRASALPSAHGREIKVFQLVEK